MLGGFARLVERGKQEVASPTALARFAVAQFRDGRRLPAGNRRGTSCRAAPNTGSDLGSSGWSSSTAVRSVARNRGRRQRATPAEIAACRIDFASWLKMLPRRSRKIALMLASGETTSEAAMKFGVSAARISQIRMWLRIHWDVFQAEATGQVEMATA